MLGDSAGRSAGNTPRASARRRFTERERTALTPLPDDPQAWPDDVPPRRRVLTDWVHDLVVAGASAGIMLFFLVLAAFTTGIASRVVFGTIVALFVAVCLQAFGSEAENARRRP